jgi:hypothetical protein
MIGKCRDRVRISAVFVIVLGGAWCDVRASGAYRISLNK